MGRHTLSKRSDDLAFPLSQSDEVSNLLLTCTPVRNQFSTLDLGVLVQGLLDCVLLVLIKLEREKLETAQKRKRTPL